MRGSGDLIRVYDLVNAGPKHRFTTASFVVHNCLGLGYGLATPAKFVKVAKTMANADIPLENAGPIIQDYRRENPGVVGMWSRLDQDMRYAAAQGEPTYEIQLPSGRSLIYFQPMFIDRKVHAIPALGGNARTYFGGKLTENVIQAIARDILVHDWVELHKSGFDVRFTVHDEFVINLPKDRMTKDDDPIREIERILNTPPGWAKSCPMGSEIKVTDHYCK